MATVDDGFGLGWEAVEVDRGSQHERIGAVKEADQLGHRVKLTISGGRNLVGRDVQPGKKEAPNAPPASPAGEG